LTFTGAYTDCPTGNWSVQDVLIFSYRNSIQFIVIYVITLTTIVI